ncbi:hypothetical protein [Actinomadura luteofluorescens]|uniref:hypothetical protein n=1 Tax=Actinomadura luteofluorescens TaxID=46163 RepID=UPI003D8D72FA
MSERKLATAALNAVLRGDHPAADRALDQLAAQHGMAGVTNALVTWCDTALKQIPSGAGPVTLQWVEHGTARVHGDANRVRPAERWAGRLLAARAAGDRHTFIALVESVPPTRAAVGEHVGAMVQMAAHIIQGA